MPDRRLKILFVTPHCPFAQSYGAQCRALQTGRLLQRCGDLSLVLVPLLCDHLEESALAKTQAEFKLEATMKLSPASVSGWKNRLRHEFDPFFPNTYGAKLPPEDAQRLNALAEKHDLVWFQTLVVPNSSGRRLWPRSVLDVDDVPSRFHCSAMKGSAGLAGKWMSLRRVWIWKRRERILLNRFSTLAVCSDDDRRYLGSDPRIHVIPNGFEPPMTRPERIEGSPKRIGFIGLLKYPPNREGLTWFAKTVWPLIKRSYPTVRLRLVGAGTDAVAPELGPDVDGLGWVADPAAEVASWSLTVVPIRVGGGTRIKIAEGFSRRCPVVSTSLGAFGYSLKSGEEILLADEPHSFAQACTSILANPELGMALAERAWQKYLQTWTWDAIAPRVKGAIQHSLQNSGVTSGSAAESLMPIPASR
jgi:glycosyltransferase involved in cell wall biosynthesis